MSNMHKLDQRGSLLIPLVLVSVLLLTAIGFGAWAFAGRQDYKNNVDAKIAEAVKESNNLLTIEKEADFAEREKEPFTTYKGPSAFGSLSITYPKTWSAYILEVGSGPTPVEGYLHPRFVPNTQSETSFALRFDVLDSNYDQQVKKFESKIKSGKITAAAYRAPKVEDIAGLLLEGEIDIKKTGTMVILPMRDKTIRIWTEGQDFRKDFDKMLETFSFNQ